MPTVFLVAAISVYTQTKCIVAVTFVRAVCTVRAGSQVRVDGLRSRVLDRDGIGDVHERRHSCGRWSSLGRLDQLDWGGAHLAGVGDRCRAHQHSGSGSRHDMKHMIEQTCGQEVSLWSDTDNCLNIVMSRYPCPPVPTPRVSRECGNKTEDNVENLRLWEGGHFFFFLRCGVEVFFFFFRVWEYWKNNNLRFRTWTWKNRIRGRGWKCANIIQRFGTLIHRKIEIFVSFVAVL